MNIIAKLLKSIISSDMYILIFGFITLYVVLKVNKLRNLVDNDIFDWEEKSDELSNNPEKNNKIFDSYKHLNRSYTVFITLISIFPLLGMFGTVIALLSIDMNDTAAINAAQSSFLDALTSTTWGIIFAVGYKIVNAYYFADVEDLIQRLLSLKKKLIKYGIDESLKNKSRWRI
ncbi:MotA/TolQ/ExbB proton channel family protein [uncultured Ruminococcus sp.]|jgi:chemotaxis protein MotA|uniref:MotA/TolQ/ExbB proton channel family protein n=1 Tax=uncultured Ruminococcus sp. TaxID=165186 RepID=UPI0025EB011A|nr:MotA/TolQ/ExbB proton channel family protein [uncultured Ruminococcus sp.]